MVGNHHASRPGVPRCGRHENLASAKKRPKHSTLRRQVIHFGMEQKAKGSLLVRVGAAPVTWRCTSYVALHPFRTGAMPTDRVHRPHQQAQPRIRTPPHGQALHHWAYAHVVEGLFMRLWPRPLIVAGIGVVSQGPEEGLAAVPVGGGRARAGLEIDHSEPQARVWRSRGRAAAHRHTQRPDPSRQATQRPGPSRQAARRPEICRGNKQHEAARPHRGPGGSRIRPLGGSQRLFQRICVPAAPRRWQASTTRAAMPASADLPHVRGSYCFLMPTSPSILRTPS